MVFFKPILLLFSFQSHRIYRQLPYRRVHGIWWRSVSWPLGLACWSRLCNPASEKCAYKAGTEIHRLHNDLTEKYRKQVLQRTWHASFPQIEGSCEWWGLQAANARMHCKEALKLSGGTDYNHSCALNVVQAIHHRMSDNHLPFINGVFTPYVQVRDIIWSFIIAQLLWITSIALRPSILCGWAPGEINVKITTCHSP